MKYRQQIKKITSLLVNNYSEDKLHAIVNQIAQVEKIFKEIKAYTILQHPNVNRVDKHAIIDMIDNHLHLSPKVKIYIILLIDNTLISYFPKIVISLRTLVKSITQTLSVTITNNKPLVNQNIQEISHILTKKNPGKHFDMQHKIDKTLGGGMRILIDDKICNMSNKGKLERIQQQLILQH